MSNKMSEFNFLSVKLIRETFVALLALFGPGQVQADELLRQQPICKLSVAPLVTDFPDNPQKFAEAVMEGFLELKSVMPTATPDEKRWLELELAGDKNRYSRARNSTIFAQVALEDYVDGSLLALEFLTGERTPRIAHSMNWSFFAVMLLGQSHNVGSNVQRLVDTNLIGSDSLPSTWQLFLFGNVSDAVVLHHKAVVEHVLTCILPVVTVQQNP